MVLPLPADEQSAQAEPPWGVCPTGGRDGFGGGLSRPEGGIWFCLYLPTSSRQCSRMGQDYCTWLPPLQEYQMDDSKKRPASVSDRTSG